VWFGVEEHVENSIQKFVYKYEGKGSSVVIDRTVHV
jgi:hypothetical protein